VRQSNGYIVGFVFRQQGATLRGTALKRSVQGALASSYLVRRAGPSSFRYTPPPTKQHGGDKAWPAQRFAN
jgi:hypothetical protein